VRASPQQGRLGGSKKVEAAGRAFNLSNRLISGQRDARFRTRIYGLITALVS